MESINKTLFYYAPHELSHSAFWAWVFNCLCSKSKLHDIPRKLAEAFLNDIGVSDDKQVVDVETEVTGKQKKNRFDIVVYFDDGKCLVIENKVISGLDLDQLKRYQNNKSLKSDKDKDNEYYIDKRVFLFTGYDFGYREKIESHNSKWQVIDSYQVSEMLNSIINLKENDILCEYSLWIDFQHNEWAKLRQNLFSENAIQINESLKKSIGQWELFKYLFRNPDKPVKGELYNGVNRGGTPWTEFCFYLLDDPPQGDYDLDTEHPDELFYRIDCPVQKDQIKITLKQYLHKNYFQKKDRDNNKIWELKKERLILLRGWFSEVLKESQLENKLTIGRPNPRGQYKSEIRAFLFKTDTDLKVLTQVIQQFHLNFLNKLKKKGWDLSKSKYGYK